VKSSSKIDREIIRRIQENDESFLELVYQEYYTPLCNYAFIFLKSRELAEDIVHETIIKVWENRNSIRIMGSFRAYLYRAVHNNCINALKETEVFRRLHKKIADQTFHRNALITKNLDPDFLQELYVSDFEADFKEAFQKLPAQCREIFMLSRFEYLSYQEIAEKLNLSVNTVKTQMKRAIARLKESLGQ
jgi:RNA polymerase sigma-70 factor (ECF subfamily)